MTAVGVKLEPWRPGMVSEVPFLSIPRDLIKPMGSVVSKEGLWVFGDEEEGDGRWELASSPPDDTILVAVWKWE